MPIYRTAGELTGTIEQENVDQAQVYLTQDDMTKYLDPPFNEVVEHIEWKLEGDGHNWSVTAFALRPLSDDELKELSEWVSGQNSDGLGESFEQQEFAWNDDGGCGECDDCIHGYGCEQEDGGSMISFDWQTNDCAFERVK